MLYLIVLCFREFLGWFGLGGWWLVDGGCRVGSVVIERESGRVSIGSIVD